MLTLFTKTHIETFTLEFLIIIIFLIIIRAIAIICRDAFYIHTVYFIYIPDINGVIAIRFIYKGSFNINLLFFIYNPNTINVSVIIFTTVIHFGTIKIFTAVRQILSNGRF